MPNLAGILASFGQALTWACATVILRSLSTRLDAFLINGVRALIGLVLIVPLVLFQGVQGYGQLTAAQLALLIGSVLIGGVIGNTLNLLSLRVLGVGRSFPISNTAPLFTLLFGLLILGEPVPWKMVPGSLLVLAGVYLIARPRGRQIEPAVPQLSAHEQWFGVLLALSAAVLWGLNAVILSIGLRGIGGVLGSSIRVPVVALVSLGVAALRGHLSALRQIDRRTMGLLAAGGILGWGVSSTLYALSVELVGPSLAMILGSTSPLFAVPMSMWWLGERPTARTILGTCLAVVGIVLVL